MNRPQHYDPRAFKFSASHIQYVTVRDRFDWETFVAAFVFLFVFGLTLFS